jgi:hypothetical protein
MVIQWGDKDTSGAALLGRGRAKIAAFNITSGN